MGTLHPKIEIAFDRLYEEVLIRIASDFTPQAKEAEFYGELGSEIMELRDKYRKLSEKEIRPECSNTRSGNKPINNESIPNIYEEPEKVKMFVNFSMTDTGFEIKTDGEHASSRLLKEMFDIALRVNSIRRDPQ